MKKYIYNSLFILLATLLIGCQEKENFYSGNSYVMFSDSSLVMPVTATKESNFDIYVGATLAENYDRTYVVDVNIGRTNAIEGYHFDILSRNVTIKAGERAGKITLKGYFDHITRTDSLALTLKLINVKGEKFDIYGDEVNVHLYKCYPFNIDDYVGDMRMTATFPFSQEAKNYLVKSKKIDDHTLIIETPFDDSYDLKVKFLSSDDEPMNNEIKVVEQAVFQDASYGLVFAQTIDGDPSYYIAADRGLVLLLNMFLPKVGAFGNYLYAFKWITPYEAEAEKNDITTPYSISNSAVKGFFQNK
ncbi:MAG: DUF4984 domain-containing protein [Bacteroides sp.]